LGFPQDPKQKSLPAGYMNYSMSTVSMGWAVDIHRGGWMEMEQLDSQQTDHLANG